MRASSRREDGEEAVVPYCMHVSSRYLDLTRQKLELTRLPRECSGQDPELWTLGPPKSVLEPLLDYWLDTYDWRTEEAHLNKSLPQFRTMLSAGSQPPLRIHFVHKRSTNPNAIPLLLCHSWPSSFIEAQRIIDALVRPDSVDQQAFHLVVPSIPGFGFSDASADPDVGIWGTAEIFGKLMKRLGYERFVACGSDWGFHVCRALAVKDPHRCQAVHTINPVFSEPLITKNPWVWMKWSVARLVRARLPALSFGYTSSDVSICRPTAQFLRPLGPTLHRTYSLRPQTWAFSWCDSPVGLLAGLLDMIYFRGLSKSAVASRLPLISVNGQSLESVGSGHERVRSDETVMPKKGEQSGAWSASDILNWTMMTWLPGAEAGLRWLTRACDETAADTWNTAYCPVPLGITSFQKHDGTRACSPAMWGSKSWAIAWVKRHEEAAEMAAWEAPETVVLDLREYFGVLVREGVCGRNSRRLREGGHCVAVSKQEAQTGGQA